MASSGDYDVVAVELCQARYDALTAERKWTDLDLYKIIRQGKAGLVMANLALKTELPLVPIGGGGLIAGIAVYIKMLCPNIKVIGVEPDDADAMVRKGKVRNVCWGFWHIWARIFIFRTYQRGLSIHGILFTF